MGAFRISARTSYTLWKTVRPWNGWRSTSLESMDSSCNSRLVSQTHQFRWFVTSLVTVDEDSFHSASRRCHQHLAFWSCPASTASMPRNQSVRKISSCVSIRMASEEDLEVKSTGQGGDLKEDEVEVVEDHDDSASDLSPEKVAERDSRREVLWGRLDKLADRSGQTVEQIKSYISESHNLTKEDVVFVISRCNRFSRFKQAMEISDWIAESKVFPWTENDQVTHLTLKGKLGTSAEVEALFENSPPEHQVERAYNAVMKHYCERGMVKKAKEWLDKSIKSGHVTHAFPFNRLMVLYKDKNLCDKVSEVVEAMNTANVQKDKFTYNILMATKSKQKDVLGFEKVFEECEADPNTSVDPANYAGLASAYIENGFPDKAATALETGEKLGLKRPGNVDDVIATLWAKLGNKEKVFKTWEIMRQKESVAARTYIVMIETFGKLGMVDEAELVYKEMEHNKGTVRPRQFTSLLSAYAQNNMIDRAEALITGMADRGIKRAASLNHHIVGMFLKMGRLDKALSFINKVQGEGGCPFWFRTILMMLNAVAEKGDVLSAEKFFDKLSTTYNQKTQTIFNSLLKAYSEAKLPAEGFLERMSAAGVAPNKETHELLQLCPSNETPVSAPASDPVAATVAPVS